MADSNQQVIYPQSAGAANAQSNTISTDTNMAINGDRSRKRRIPLSCGECRKKKLSCDRKKPCQRCVRTGRSEQCSYAGDSSKMVAPNQAQKDQIQELQAEVAQLKALLAKTGPQRDNTPPSTIAEATPNTAANISSRQIEPTVYGTSQIQDHVPTSNTAKTRLDFLKVRAPHSYYHQHSLFLFLNELPQLYKFVGEVVDEWLKPRGVSLKKRKPKIMPCSHDAEALQRLLPPKDDTDTLVSFYLDHLEQIHRVVHIPTFRQEYASFWVPGQPRRPAFVTLVLAMLAISTPLSNSSSASAHRSMPPKWISACDSWLSQQNFKICRLTHYQVFCLVYLSKRLNSIKKKWFWIETSTLIHTAIMDSLHRDPSPTYNSPFMMEMKRRIWAVVRELDLQSSFEFGLPTILHNMDSNVAAPANIDDEDIQETSICPEAKPSSQKTRTSYQSQSARSWALRLEISRRLFHTGTCKALDYEDVLRYTHELTRELDSLPSWNAGEAGDRDDQMSCLLTSTMLKLQLKECILVIHRPYLKPGSRYSLSEMICYHTSRDMLLMNRELANFGIQSLTLLREDLLMSSLSLTHVALLQPRESMKLSAQNSENMIELLEQCLPFIENRYLRCFYGEPWCPLSMAGAIMALRIHAGRDSRQTAKSACAQRFLDLYYRHFSRQETHNVDLDNQVAETPSFPDVDAQYMEYPEFDLDLFDLGMDDDTGRPWMF